MYLEVPRTVTYSKCYISVCRTSSSLTHKVSEMVKGVTVNQVFRVVLGTS